VVTGGTSIALSGAGGATTLTIGDGTGDDLVVSSTSVLTQTSSLENIILTTNATADISGTFKRCGRL